MRSIAITFLGNIHYDTRTFNLYHSLKKRGHHTQFYGFDWEQTPILPPSIDNIYIHHLKKGSFSVFFYLEFLSVLLWKTLKHRTDIYVASDFYSLPICLIASKWHKSQLFYDARDLITELTSLNNKPFLRKVFGFIERYCIQRASLTLTTGEMDTKEIQRKYNVSPIQELRNLPQIKPVKPIDYKSKLRMQSGFLMVYQGILVPGRGIETYFEILSQLPDSGLLLLGTTADIDYYKNLAIQKNVLGRVIFAGRYPQNELLNHTAGADIGLSMIDNISNNCYFALPNKLFEYIMAGIPVIVSDLPQMRAIVEKYQVGAVVPDGDSDKAVQIIRDWQANPSRFQKLRENCQKASRELNWDSDFQNIARWFD